MRTVFISLNSIDKVKAFVHIVNSFDSNFDIISGHNIIDAKSIMGILSLDLKNPLQLNIYNDDDPQIIKKLEPYFSKTE